MTPERLVPLREAAERIGVAPKTLRNDLAAARAGLPVARPPLPVVRIGNRLYVKSTDLDAYMQNIITTSTGDASAELRQAADAVAGVFPDVADTLRALASRVNLRAEAGGGAS